MTSMMTTSRMRVLAAITALGRPRLAAVIHRLTPSRYTPSVDAVGRGHARSRGAS
jgi:hypothetical protein